MLVLIGIPALYFEIIHAFDYMQGARKRFLCQIYLLVYVSCYGDMFIYVGHRKTMLEPIFDVGDMTNTFITNIDVIIQKCIAFQTWRLTLQFKNLNQIDFDRIRSRNKRNTYYSIMYENATYLL